jgi:hypothetical protein
MVDKPHVQGVLIGIMRSFGHGEIASKQIVEMEQLRKNPLRLGIRLGPV